MPNSVEVTVFLQASLNIFNIKLLVRLSKILRLGGFVKYESHSDSKENFSGG